MDTQQAEIQLNAAAKISSIETIVKDMHVRLFGNGQPGELTRIGSRIADVEKDLDTLKEDRAKAKGVLWTLTGLFTALGGTEIWHMFTKK